MNDDAGDETPPLPTTSAEWEALGPAKPESVWSIDRTSGDVADSIGGVSLEMPRMPPSPEAALAVTGWTRKSLAPVAPVAPDPSTQSIAMISYIDTRPRPVLDVIDRVGGTEQHFVGKPGEDRGEFLERVLSPRHTDEDIRRWFASNGAVPR